MNIDMIFLLGMLLIILIVFLITFYITLKEDKKNINIEQQFTLNLSYDELNKIIDDMLNTLLESKLLDYELATKLAFNDKDIKFLIGSVALEFYSNISNSLKNEIKKYYTEEGFHTFLYKKLFKITSIIISTKNK